MELLELKGCRRPERSAFTRGFVIALLVITPLGLIGCGSSDRPKTIPISGRVTIDGQAPNEFGKLFFTPTQAADGYKKRPASGSYDLEGIYRVMSWEPDDGLVPGHYTVSLMPVDASATKIPEKYHQSGTSGLEVDVPVDEAKIEYDVNVVTQ
jgi:hypothetical protein